MTPFSLLLQISGLSQREAASFLAISPSSVDKMARGVRTTPKGVISDLRCLIDRQAVAASKMRALIDAQELDLVEMGYPADDYEAQSLGWPCVGAWAAMAARVTAGADVPVVLVPRGSTPTSATAADAHEARHRK